MQNSTPKHVLVLGSTVCDVIMHVEESPRCSEDVNIFSQKMQLGGCAFNVASVLTHFASAHTLCSPVGSGVYGDFVRKELLARTVPIFAERPEANGCCYCIVDKSGERTFLCHHGAEYLFDRSAFASIADSSYNALYVCGLELEEATAEALISFIEEKTLLAQKEKRDLTVYFAPSPRICSIKKQYMERLFATRAFLHLNRDEALRYTQAASVEEAARALSQQTQNSLVITLGAEGALYYDAQTATCARVPSPQVSVVDTIGAGDSHCGAVIACLQRGLSLADAVRTANTVSAAVVSVSGATLSKPEFDALAL